MATSKWSAACQVELGGRAGTYLSDRTFSGLAFKPEQLERAVSLHISARKASAVEPAGIRESGTSEGKRKASVNARTSITGRASTPLRKSLADRGSVIASATERSFTSKRTGETDDDMSARVTANTTQKTLADCVSFKRSSMLRGTRAAGVLRSFGRIFKNSEGSSSTFKLSSPVDKLDYFISHNWSTKRQDKFFVLSTLFNLQAAIVASLVAGLLTVPLAVWGYLPMVEFVDDLLFAWEVHRDEELPLQEVYKESVTATLFGSAAGFLIWAFGHEIRALVGWKGPVCFLDKTCIHQTDMALKREGIESLAAFLEKSDGMIIIYSKTYLKKLWTVYELATMLLLHPERKIMVMPCVFPKVTIFGFLLTITLVVWKRLLMLPPVAEVLKNTTGLKDAIPLLSLMMCVTFALVFQKILTDWARDRAEITKVLQSFSIRNAECFAEADRLVVQDNIVSFMRDLSLVERSDEEEDEAAFQRRALDAFDDVVRTEVPPALEASLGRQNVGYGQAVFMFIPSVLKGFDLIAPCILGLVPVRKLALRLAQELSLALCIMPLVMAMLMRTALRHRAAPSRRFGCCTRRIVSEFMLVFVPSYSAAVALETSRYCAAKDDRWLAVFAVLVATCVALAVYFFRPVRYHKGNREALSGALAHRRSSCG